MSIESVFEVRLVGPVEPQQFPDQNTGEMVNRLQVEVSGSRVGMGVDERTLSRINSRDVFEVKGIGSITKSGKLQVRPTELRRLKEAEDNGNGIAFHDDAAPSAKAGSAK